MYDKICSHFKNHSIMFVGSDKVLPFLILGL